MQLHLLRRTTCLVIYYDFRNDWLYLDWQGHVTLPLLQEACLALADCFLPRPYPRVLNNNEQVTGVSWGIALWLVTDFLPHMTLAGVQQVAWVFSPSLQGRSLGRSRLTTRAICRTMATATAGRSASLQRRPRLGQDASQVGLRVIVRPGSK